MGKTHHLICLLREIFGLNVGWRSSINQYQKGTISIQMEPYCYRQCIYYFPEHMWKLFNYNETKISIKGESVNVLYRYI